MTSRADGSKLFKVLVLGGLSMAIPACSSGTTGDDAGPGGDAAADQPSPGKDAASEASAVDAGSDVCAPADKIQCPDCTHGLCGW